MIGSPPRAWGQSAAETRILQRYLVHPHGRGDNRTLRDALRALSRFTPTGVGTMGETRLFKCYVAVHPHGRGDNRRFVAAVRA